MTCQSYKNMTEKLIFVCAALFTGDLCRPYFRGTIKTLSNTYDKASLYFCKNAP